MTQRIPLPVAKQSQGCQHTSQRVCADSGLSSDADFDNSGPRDPWGKENTLLASRDH